MARAQAIYDMVPVSWAGSLPDGVKVVIVPCSDYDRFKDLPDAIEFQGRIYGLTGWNSDTQSAYFRTDAFLARALG